MTEKITEGKADMAMSTKIRKTDVGKVFNALVKAAKKLKLEQKDHGTRISFMRSGGRIVAFEKGRRQVTMHLPKIVTDIISPLAMTFDKRGFGYVRVKKVEELPDAVSLITAISELSKKSEVKAPNEVAK